jgi:hypothetical protein
MRKYIGGAEVGVQAFEGSLARRILSGIKSATFQRGFLSSIPPAFDFFLQGTGW